MKKLKPIAKRILVSVAIFLFTCALLVIPVSSYLVKYLLEKHDVEWLGREVTLDRAYVNPFTGYVHLSKVKILEAQGDSLFISADGASASFSLSKLFNHTVEITHLMIERPWLMVVQNKKQLNFDDLIQKFTPGDSVPESPWHARLLITQIIDGEFHYRDKVIPINYFIRNVNVDARSIENYQDSIAARFFLREGKTAGAMKGNLLLNLKSLDYGLALAIQDFNLEIIRQYIWELINYGMFRAHLDARITARGNLHSQENVTVKGMYTLRDLHLGKTNEDDYFSFKKMTVSIKELSPLRKIYLFDSVTLMKPYLKYESFDSLDNLQAMFGKAGKNISDVTEQAGRFNLIIEIARYTKVLTANFFKSKYKIGKLGIYDGHVVFEDYSLNEKFSTTIGPLIITADSINDRNKRVRITCQSAIQPYGALKLLLSINPKDSGDFDLKYDLEKIPAPMFNPYLITYTSFPLDRGTIELKGLWHVRQGIIESNNHLVLLDPRVTQREKNKNVKWIPLPLIMAFIREEGNVIDYEIPITGNLKNPKFHLGDVILDLIKNIFVKPPTVAYREEIKEIETVIEKSMRVKWEMRQHTLSSTQEKFVKGISSFMKDHPEVTLNVQPFEYTALEKEHILFFEAKKKYFLYAHHKSWKDFSEEDSIEVSRMSIKDHAMVKYMSRNLSDTVMFTIQEKCLNFVGAAVVDANFKKLTKAREVSFRSIFRENGTNDRLNMGASKSSIPYNGFSQFVLSYPGEIPESLQKAYTRMMELNEEGPRKKYLEQRKKADKALIVGGN